MVGDRNQDMIAAKAHGLTAIGVTWGYGSREELLSTGADILVDTMAELDAELARLLPGDEVHDAFTRSE